MDIKNSTKDEVKNLAKARFAQEYCCNYDWFKKEECSSLTCPHCKNEIKLRVS